MSFGSTSSQVTGYQISVTIGSLNLVAAIPPDLDDGTEMDNDSAIQTLADALDGADGITLGNVQKISRGTQYNA
jgi:hypothetical protein